MSNAGRHPKWNKERCAAIAESLSAGMSAHLAALSNGISRKTLFNWINEAEKFMDQGIENDLTEFLHSIKKKEGIRQLKHIENVNAAGERWQADAWMLERRWWKDYSKSAPLLDLEQRLQQMEEGSLNGKAKEMDSESDQK